jgi:DNA-directed RNA polymerase sigma subunit (sigma70/sigma32)
MKDSPSQQLWNAVFGPGPAPCLRETRVLQVLEGLGDARGQQVVLMRYWQGKSLQEIADTLPRASGLQGVSKERVRQIHHRTLRRLRHPSRRALWQRAVQEAVGGE